MNYTAMFVAFMQGAGAEEIADSFEVSVSTVQTISRQQRWPALARKAQEVAVPLLDDDVSLKSILMNRAKNLTQAVRLRDELDGSIALVTANGTMSVAPYVLKELTKAACDIHDLTYRAVGDKNQQRDPNQAAPNTAQIVINMPTQLQAPRIEQVVHEIPPSSDRVGIRFYTPFYK